MDQRQLDECGDITSLLKQGKDGLAGALQVLRFSTDHDVERFLAKYDGTPERDRKAVTWEAIALAAGVSPSALLGAAILAIQQYSANAVKIIALSNHPEITKARVKFGRMKEGAADRLVLDQSLGFMPTSRGSTMNINFGFGERKDKLETGTPAQPELPMPETVGNGELNHLFPSLTGTQEELVPVAVRTLEGK